MKRVSVCHDGGRLCGFDGANGLGSINGADESAEANVR